MSKEIEQNHNGNSTQANNGSSENGKPVEPIEMVDDALSSIAGDFGGLFIEESLAKGKVIEIPSLGITIPKRHQVSGNPDKS